MPVVDFEPQLLLAVYCTVAVPVPLKVRVVLPPVVGETVAGPETTDQDWLTDKLPEPPLLEPVSEIVKPFAVHPVTDEELGLILTLVGAESWVKVFVSVVLADALPQELVTV